MARKTVGYVHMEWTCPNCNSRNPGTAEVCASCGAPQPEDVQFQQAVQEKLVEDEKLIARAQAGPDVHCPFCGARNPASAAQCSKCLADLTDAAAREKGRVAGAHRTGKADDVTCPFCGAANAAANLKCTQCSSPLPHPEKEAAPRPQPKAPQGQGRGRAGMWIALAAALLVLACGALIVLTNRTEETIGRVAGVSWTRTVMIEGLGPVEYETWLDQIPNDAEIGLCREELRYTSPNPQPNSVEVCGTPYTVDTGTGVGEVVQDCEYQVYDDMCAYTVLEWQVVDQVSASGADFTPAWPTFQLTADQREGEREETYEVIFDTDGRSYTYRPRSVDELQMFDAGSRWILHINAFNAVREVEPAN